jgi:hypothetical protein
MRQFNMVQDDTVRLKHFPFVWKAFKLILADQPYMDRKVTIPGITPVAAKLLQRFERAESALAKLYGVRLGTIGVTMADLAKEHCAEDLRLTDSAFETVVLPVNDVQRVVYKRAGISKADAKTTDKVLYEFFDGNLRNIFQKGHLSWYGTEDARNVARK